MSDQGCPECPHCQQLGLQLGVKKGGLSLQSDLSAKKDLLHLQTETPFLPHVDKKRVRGKSREYTEAFEIAWKAYGRKDQKFEAFGVWIIRSKESGGEPALLTLVLGALKWQGPAWANEGWRFAPYFERYLKRRKWEDEPMPVGERVSEKVGRSRAAALSWMAEQEAKAR